MRRLRALVLLLAVAVAGCSEVDSALEHVRAGEEIAPAYGDTLIEALLGNISGLIPNITSDTASHDVGRLLYNALLRHDRDLHPTGDLAESWEFSSDCLDLTFRLREGVRWHDGAPFTADDVVFTYEATIDPRTPSPYKVDFSEVAAVEALDDHTIHVRYKRPYAKALTSWASHTILPRHLLESYVAEGRIREAPQNWNAPVGTGPYRFAEVKAGERVVLVANPDYFDGRPHISRVVYRIIPSQATTFLELKAQGVDAASLTALQYTRQTDYPAFRKAYERYNYPGSAYTYLGFNLRDRRFADRRVRQAFAHAIDKQALIDGVIMGLGREATGPYKPGTWPYTDRVRRYPFDQERARQLLAEAGWKERNAQGILVKDGQPFAFELLTNQGNDERKRIAELVQAALGEIGVDVRIRVIEWAALLKEHIRKRNFEALVLGWGIGVDPDQYVVWHSSQQAPEQLNHIGYANPEVDALLEKGRSSCLQDDRVPIYHRLQEVLAEDQPLVFLYFRDALQAVSSRVHGIDPGPNGIRHNFTEWFVPRHLHRYTAG
jgi:peptide/nickel transport system substrate-binding protein